MDIDLSLLHSRTKEEIDITNSYDIPKEYYEKSDIENLSTIKVEGRIIEKEDEYEIGQTSDYVICTISGKMFIKDSISLQEVEYPFTIEYDDFLEENCKKSENILDIFQFLWENIVLEVPLQFTKVEDLSKFHGDGWKLISEDELVTTKNPFGELLKDFEEE